MLVLFASNVPTIAETLLRNDMAKTLQLLLVSTLPKDSAGGSKEHDTGIDIIPRSPQELYEITCLVGELLPALPGNIDNKKNS